MIKDDHRHKNAERIMKQAGYSCKPGNYAKGGAVHKDEAEDKKLIKKMVKKKDLKPEHKKDGGFVHGGMPKKRLDKISRQTAKGGDKNTSMPFTTDKEHFAKGGKVKGKAKTQINVIVGHGGQPQGAPPAPPMAMPPSAPPPQMAPHPMPPQGAPGMAPPPGGMPPMGRAKGGKVDMKFGGGGGLGRLEKIKEYGKKPKN